MNGKGKDRKPIGMQVVKADDIVIKHRPDEFKSYSNHVGVLLTAEEAGLFFSLRTPETPLEAEGVATIYLAHSHLKRLADALNRAVMEYESVFGEIVVDPAKRMTPAGRKQLGLTAEDE